MPSADLSRLTAIVYTSGRTQSVQRAVRSIALIDPRLKIMVADDAKKPAEIPGADLVKVPTGCGVSAARNALLARLRTPYFLLVEDDMELTRNSGVDHLLALVAENQVDLAAGELVTCRKRLGLFTTRTPSPGHTTFELTGDVLKLAAGHRPGAGWFSCDAAHNFFVGRTDKVRGIGGWDAQLQVDERIEFFYRAYRYGLRVAVCPDCFAWRWADKLAAVNRTARSFAGLAAAKIGVAQLVDAEGRVHEAASLTRAA